MFVYYRFRFSMFRSWNPEFGFELMAPAAICGVVLIVLILYLTSPDFGFLMWRSPVSLPGRIAFGLVVTLLVLTYVADDLRRWGLWLVVLVCGTALLATIPLSYKLSQRYAEGIYDGMTAAPSSILIGGAFAAYLLLMLALSVTRLRGLTNADDRT